MGGGVRILGLYFGCEKVCSLRGSKYFWGKFCSVDVSGLADKVGCNDLLCLHRIIRAIILNPSLKINNQHYLYTEKKTKMAMNIFIRFKHKVYEVV
jgi:hypothetical protein